MSINNFSFFITVIVFPGLALLLYFLHRNKSDKLQKFDKKIIIYTILITTILTSVADYLGTSWQAWSYNPEKTFHMTFLGSEAETYLFTLLVTLVVAIATIVSAKREDQKRNKIIDH